MTDHKKDPAAAARGAELASNFTQSLHYDRRLFKEDIAGSIAHANMLGRQGIIDSDEAAKIVDGLREIEKEIEQDQFNWKPDLEDIHMNVESRLHELIGETAGRLHTARSRNDQVATDTRLWLKSASDDAVSALREVQKVILVQAEQHANTVLPGYTHMQRGQPVVFAHHLLAYFEMFDRDAGRFLAARRAADVMTLGSGAMAGSPYPLDRESVAEELGFAAISANSMDAVSDRDFILYYLFAASMTMAHLSRMAEEFVIWSSDEFGFIQLSDEYTSGSSIMPQKRNPDFAELIRGKTGRVYGNLMALLTTVKGLPLTYNRDLQEDKEGLLDAADTVIPALQAAAGMVSGMTVDADRMRLAAERSYVLATDIADYLVRKGVPFRKAYIAVAALAKQSIAAGKGFGELSIADFKSASDLFEDDVLSVTLDSAVAARDVPGGTAPGRVLDAVRNAQQRLSSAQQGK